MNRELLDRMIGASPPSTLDIPRIIAKQRKVSTLWRTSAALVSVLALALGATAAVNLWERPNHHAPKDDTEPAAKRRSLPSAAFPVACTVEEIHVPGDFGDSAAKMDPSGRYIGVSTVSGSGVYQTWLVHDGHATEIKRPGDRDLEITGINAAGTVVGFGFDSTGSQAWVYRDGAVKDLAGTSAQPFAINSHGVIVGNQSFARVPGSVLTRERPAVWMTADSQPAELPLPDGFDGGGALGVDDDGTIVGYVGIYGSTSRAYYWDARHQGHFLAVPQGDSPRIRATAARQASNGWVIGQATVDKGKGQSSTAGLRWDLITGEVRIPDGLNRSLGVNDYGWIAGVNEQDRAVLSDGSQVLRLPAARQLSGEYARSQANSISADGHTAVGREEPDGAGRAVLWRCA